MKRNHYQILGLEPTASREEVVAAVQRLSDQAAVLVYSSPQQSHELWERIRHIREDLLLDSERRAQYDRSLLAAREEAAIAPALVPPPAPLSPEERWSAMRRPAVIWQSLGAALVLAIALFIAFGPRSRANRPAGPLALALSNSGVQHRYAYVSGQRVHLRWGAVGKALVYRLQVATGMAGSKDRSIFRHPMLTQLTLGTTYWLKVSGPQLYYWRVQAYVGGAWTPFTRSQHFLVAPPRATPPVAPTVRIAQGPARKPTRVSVAALVRTRRRGTASRPASLASRAPASRRPARVVREVAALVPAPPLAPRRFTGGVARPSVRPPVPAPAVRAPRRAAPRPVGAPAVRSPISPPVLHPAPKPPGPPPVYRPAPRPPTTTAPTPMGPPPVVARPPVSAPVVAAPRPPAPVAPAPRPPVARPPSGNGSQPVTRVPAPPAPLGAPARPTVPVGAPPQTSAQSTSANVPQRNAPAPAPAGPTVPSAVPTYPPHTHHVITPAQGPAATEQD